MLLKLGAGIGLPGLVAASVGANVVLTDVETALPLCKENCTVNAACMVTQPQVYRLFVCGLMNKVMCFHWGLFTKEIIELQPFDIIISADIFYDNTDGKRAENTLFTCAEYEDIIASIEFFLRKNPNAIFLTTYQVRRYYFWCVI